MAVAIKHQFEREKEAVIERALSDGWRKLGLEPDTILTIEHITKLSGFIVEQMLPFIRHFTTQHRDVAPHSIPTCPGDDSDHGH